MFFSIGILTLYINQVSLYTPPPPPMLAVILRFPEEYYAMLPEEYYAMLLVYRFHVNLHVTSMQTPC